METATPVTLEPPYMPKYPFENLDHAKFHTTTALPMDDTIRFAQLQNMSSRLIKKQDEELLKFQAQVKELTEMVNVQRNQIQELSNVAKAQKEELQEVADLTKSQAEIEAKSEAHAAEVKKVQEQLDAQTLLLQQEQEQSKALRSTLSITTSEKTQLQAALEESQQQDQGDGLTELRYQILIANIYHRKQQVFGKAQEDKALAHVVKFLQERRNVVQYLTRHGLKGGPELEALLFVEKPQLMQLIHEAVIPKVTQE